MRFLHVGIPTNEEKSREVYVESLKVYYTNPDEHPYSIEYFRCEDLCSLPEIIKTQPHIAYRVESIGQIIKDVDEVLVRPFVLDKTMIAYALKEGLIMELYQNV